MFSQANGETLVWTHSATNKILFDPIFHADVFALMCIGVANWAFFPLELFWVDFIYSVNCIFKVAW